MKPPTTIHDEAVRLGLLAKIERLARASRGPRFVCALGPAHDPWTTIDLDVEGLDELARAEAALGALAAFYAAHPPEAREVVVHRPREARKADHRTLLLRGRGLVAQVVGDAAPVEALRRWLADVDAALGEREGA